MSAYGHFHVNKTMIVFPIINYKLTYTVTYLGRAKIPFLLGVCLCCYVLYCHLIVFVCAMLCMDFWPIYIVGLFTSVQPEVVGMFLFNYIFVPCFAMDLWPTYGFGLSVFVQLEVVGRFLWHHRERYFYVSATCVVCQTIPVIVHVHVHVVKSCLLC